MDRRAVAQELSEELLADIELSRVGPTGIVRKAFRLARLLDDHEAQSWLHYEVVGYDTGQPVDEPASKAATRSRRDFVGDSGERRYQIVAVGRMAEEIEAGRLQIAAATDPSISLTSANQYQQVTAPPGNQRERSIIREHVASTRDVLDRVVGSILTYVVERNYELRFGAAVQSSFERVRETVDGRIAELVPDALQRLSGAFENAASDNPEHWANAASTCRRLLKSVADQLRPTGPDVGGRKMGPDNYINRLADWIAGHETSSTSVQMSKSELEHLGQRLDAADGAGQKGAHAEVTQFQASRYIAGTYLLLGDILLLSPRDAQNDDVVSRSGAAS